LTIRLTYEGGTHRYHPQISGDGTTWRRLPTPVTIRFDDAIRFGYQAGCTEQGMGIVYLPGSPDPWIGSVVLVGNDRIQALPVEFGKASAICERLGRGSEHLLATVRLHRFPRTASRSAEPAQD
jgi:hypothetical protein